MASFDDRGFPVVHLSDDGWSTEEEATATCFCGAVQLILPLQKPGLINRHICHCTDCRKIGSAFYQSNITVLSTHLKHTRGSEHLTTFSETKTIRASNSMENHFCKTCGTLIDLAVGSRDYVNAAAFPTNGSLEIVLWQSYKPPSVADETFQKLLYHPAVIPSMWKNKSREYQGFGISCMVDSRTGTADLHAERRSYSNFSAKVSSPLNISLAGFNSFNSYPGIVALQNIVFAGFTNAVLNVMAPLTCENSNVLSSVTCNPWYGANIATGGVPEFAHGSDKEPQIQLQTISPARFKLAIQKLFGEATIAMMAQGEVNWEGNLHGIDPTTALVPGKVPWSIVLTLLVLWSAVTSIPSLWVFGRKRWADTLSGFDMFRFGAEWKEAVWQFEENEFEKCPILLEVPGMIGDMEANVMDTGFIGLSKDEARKNGSFVFARDAVI
ncbi:hypothetical protein JADG_009804 [Aureobasidium aubasidani]|nr:hypothetical protein JADG_009804 [Aureobasidium pullulans]